jgi:uncharacterized protein with HEPN domain
MRDDRERLRDILEAIDRVVRYTPGGRAQFISSDLVQAAVAHCLQLIGEAASKLNPKTRELAPNVRWPEIVKMRNFLIHQYFDVDHDEVWDAVERDLPPLKREIEKLLNDLKR